MVRLREVISEFEYRRLNAYVRADNKLRETTKQNIIKSFIILYYSGCRVSELLQLRNHHIINIIEHGEVIINIEKQKKERKLIFSDKAVKAIKSLFIDLNIEDENTESYVIRAKGVNHLSPHKSNFTKLLNNTIHKCLGDRFTSHSFRAGIITELAENGVSTAIIRDFIGHKNASTTLLYVKSSKSSIRNSLIR